MARLVDLERIATHAAAPMPEWLYPLGPTGPLYFAAEPFHGAPTKVFAHLATPPAREGVRCPAIVLVHGGGGRAFAHWATVWAQRGYVAIALDLTGCGPDRARHEWAGPAQDNAAVFENLTAGVDQAWMYHAVADVLHAVSLLSARPDVDPDRIAVTGISWGAHVAELAVALDPRPRVAAFVYGCGYMKGNPTWAPVFDRLPTEVSDLWTEEFDARNYLARIDIPTLWITGAKDAYYPLDRFQRSHGLLRRERTLRVTPDFAHSHEDGWSPVEICEFMNAHLQEAAPLARLGALVGGDGRVHADLMTDLPILGAELHYTLDHTAWSEREWLSVPAVVMGKAVSATVPTPEPATYFLTVEDARGLVVSSPYCDQ